MNAFLAIHGIGRDRLRRKIQDFDVDVQDNRGKHNSRPNRTKSETLDKVHDYIKNLPCRESHYSRSQNKYRKYLPSECTVIDLHRKYSEDNPEYTISYGRFLKIFNEDYNISFGYPRKDICVKLQNDDQQVRELNLQKEIHIRKAEVFYTLMKEKRDNPKPDEMVICFDYQKNLPLPVTNIKDEYYLRQLWLHNFCINNIVTNCATMYLYTENYAGKGPNEVISCLNHFIKKKKNQGMVKLSIFCDNCFSQNKNRYLFSYLDSLCSDGIFNEIVVYYPIPGHSMMPVDRCFVQKCLTKNENDVTDVLTVLNYKQLYAPIVKTSVPGISKCRSVMFSKYGKPKMRESMTGEYDTFSLYKVGKTRPHCNGQNINNAYTGQIKLKKLKLDNVKHLVQHIETEENRKFYDVLWKEDVASQEESEEQSDVDEYE
ncbi:hypothetical protein RI129_002985 [Pyrocoelia pectoralis]|uniref:DUF7869 domain-containing protein n=1 Tax=Pyrocoelia pectoralis TaxID=417401 RepID=A0AAN7VP95_9COLE